MRLGPIGLAEPRNAADASRPHAGIEILPADPSLAGESPPSNEPHVLVCIAGDACDGELIRQGRVLADLVAGRLTVLYPFRIGAGERQRRMLTEDRTYARSLGAQLIEMPAYSTEDGITEYARTRCITHIVLSEAQSSDSLIERLKEVDWYFVLGGNVKAKPD